MQLAVSRQEIRYYSLPKSPSDGRQQYSIATVQLLFAVIPDTLFLMALSVRKSAGRFAGSRDAERPSRAGVGFGGRLFVVYVLYRWRQGSVDILHFCAGLLPMPVVFPPCISVVKEPNDTCRWRRMKWSVPFLKVDCFKRRWMSPRVLLTV